MAKEEDEINFSDDEKLLLENGKEQGVENGQDHDGHDVQIGQSDTTPIIEPDGLQEPTLSNSESTIQTEKNLCSRVFGGLWALIKKQWFPICMCISIVIAYFTPEIGKTGGILRPEYTINIGSVVVIFLISGMSVQIVALKNALLSIKHQLLVLFINFALIPFTTYGIVQLLKLANQFEGSLLDGVVVMSALPTTISSCSVLTKTADGNEAIAVVNSVIGNTLGVFISPLLVILLLNKHSDGTLNVGKIMLKLVLTVVVPMVVGVLLQLVALKAVKWVKSKVNFSLICQILLLLFIYTVFCNTFSQDFQTDAVNMTFILLLATLLEIYYMSLSWLLFSFRFLKFNWEDRVAGLFCASQKTLTLGIPLINIFFGSDPSGVGGFIALPILIIHPLQLIMGGLLADKLKSIKKAREARTEAREEGAVPMNQL